MTIRSTTITTVAVGVLFALTCPVHAQGTSLPSDSARVEARLDQALDDAYDGARAWHWSWVGLFSGGVLAQGVLIGVTNETNGRYAQAVGAIPPLVGLTLMLATPLDALAYTDDVRSIDAMASDMDARIKAKRSLLRRYAASEASKRNWFAHAGPIFLNASTAALLWLVLDEPVQGAIQLGTGVAVSQLQLWTSPRGASRAMDADEAGDEDFFHRLHPVVSAGYVGLVGTF